MDFSAYFDLFKQSDFWIMVLELIVVPALLVGPDYGLVRFLNWFKTFTNLKGKTVLGIPVMKLVAGFFSVVAAGVALLLDGSIRDVVPTPTAVIGLGTAFYALGQSWYAILENKVALESVR